MEIPLYRFFKAEPHEQKHTPRRSRPFGIDIIVYLLSCHPANVVRNAETTKHWAHQWTMITTDADRGHEGMAMIEGNIRIPSPLLTAARGQNSSSSAKNMVANMSRASRSHLHDKDRPLVTSTDQAALPCELAKPTK